MTVKTFCLGPLGTNTYLIISNNHAAVIDPAFKSDALYSELKNYKTVKVLLTHGHFDHIMGVEYLQKNFNAKVYIGQNDAFMLKNSRASFGEFFNFTHNEIKNATLVNSSTKINLGEKTITVVETPGHTKGSVCYLIDDMLFCGDLIFKENIGRSDLGGDKLDYKNTLKKLKEEPKNLIIYPGHGPKTTLNHEKQYNPYLTNNF